MTIYTDKLLIKKLPLGIDVRQILGMSGMLEVKVEQYMAEFPMECIVKPATINRGALTFKIIKTKRRKRK
jgi:hypothetical protein